MPAHINQGNEGNSSKKKASKMAPKVQIKAPSVEGKKQDISIENKERDISVQMQSVLSENKNLGLSNTPKADRTQFYAGHERLELQGSSVQRVRDLQEENDHLQREISIKEEQLSECSDPLTILADIEHRKIMIARNTGEILKIYTRNEERMKRIADLESHNNRIQKEMMDMQGRFISTKNMEEKTKFASEFFIMKSEIENNVQEINELNKK